MEDVMQSPLQLTKEQFLRNLNLVPVKKQSVSNPPPQPPSSPSQLVELRTTVNVPLTSEIGKKLLKEENHQVSEEVILRRLERKNDEGSMSLMTLSPTILQTSEYCRSYTNPKRQDHQIKNYHKQLKFCRPLSVVLEYCDLHKFKEKYKKELEENASKELSVYLKKQPKELTGSQKDVIDRKRTLSMSSILVPLESGGKEQIGHKEDNRKKLVVTLDIEGTKEASTPEINAKASQ
ncbi:uncharacterized protein LOC109602821 [Aethina tumida]|uniref:uncharacterized protein LOC109602821 n=1 Tax=Aethina tumida TaxID=116153 RepID=UPI002147E929|nr:uncharacterized protein LOC109602821 [Aethina tumida]